MDNFFAAIFHVTLFLLVYGLVSRTLKDRFFISEPMLSLIYGLLIGPQLSNLLNTRYGESKEVLFYLAKVILCLQTMAAAMSLPHGYVLRNWLSLFNLVVVCGSVKFVITGLIVFIFSKYNLTVSMAVAACLTPTDPVLAASLMQSRFAREYVPERLQHLIQAESGINDGFGLLLLLIPVDIMFSKSVSEEFSGLFKTLMYKGIFSACLGLIVGMIARKCLHRCYEKNMVGTDTFLVYGLTLTFFVLGLTEMLHMSELVGVFFAGTGFAWDEWFVFETRESRLQEIVDNLCTVSFFVLFGTRIDLSLVTFGLLSFATITICLRRPLVIFTLRKLVPQIRNKREAFIVGWLGPIGVGALYYSLYFDSIAKTNTHASVSVVVMLSVLIHGIVMISLRALVHGKFYFKEWGLSIWFSSSVNSESSSILTDSTISVLT